MKEKHFFYFLYGIMASIVLTVPVANYVIDYYSVFHGVTQKIIVSNLINERFVKMEYLLQNRNFEKYDSYLWGSSRVMKTDTQLTGKRTYNMGAATGMPEDCLRDLKRLKENGALIDTVYLGFDDFSYFKDYSEILSLIYCQPYDQKVNKRCKYYAELLFKPGIVKEWGRETLTRSPERVTSLYQTGVYLVHQTGVYFAPQETENQIEENSIEYVREKKFDNPTTAGFGGDSRFEKCIATILEIKQFCDENHIQFVPFFNPQHMTTYLNDDIELMNQFKKELVKISPFWDFSGVNYVTSNNYFWYETSHPRAFICDKILDTVSGQNQITWVPDFGVYVTEENVDAFCEKAVRDREAYDPNHEQWVPSAEERAVMTKRVNYPW